MGGGCGALPAELGRPLQTPVAQQLGLRDGQIVQATAEVRDQRVRLWLKDFFFELPNGWVLKDGDKPFLRVSQNAGSLGFLIQAYPNGQTSTATPASAAFGITKSKFSLFNGMMRSALSKRSSFSRYATSLLKL